MSGEPNVQRLLPRPASAAHREDLDVLRLGLQEFGQRSGEASERALLAPPAAEKLLYAQIWQKGGGGGYDKNGEGGNRCECSVIAGLTAQPKGGGVLQSVLLQLPDVHLSCGGDIGPGGVRHPHPQTVQARRRRLSDAELTGALVQTEQPAGGAQSGDHRATRLTEHAQTEPILSSHVSIWTKASPPPCYL